MTLKYRVFICERGDVFIFAADSGEHLWSPYRGGSDPTKPFRMLVKQESCAFTCDDLADACEFLKRERKYSESWRYMTWVSQIVSAAAHFDDMEPSK